MNRGLYIALEGMDGVGKSTVMPYISDYLKSIGRDVVEVREPGSTPLGERIRGLLKSDCPMDATSELLLMLTARHQLFKDVVLPALAEGKVVLTDRYYMSTIAYQCAGRRLNYALVETMHKNLSLWTYADYVFILQKPFDDAIKAQGGGDRFESSLDYQLRVYNFYAHQGYPIFDKKNCGHIFNIDVHPDPNVTARHITNKLSFL